MKKILSSLLIAIVLSFGLKAQTFIDIHNYQRPDGLAIAKAFGIPYGPDTTWNGVNPIIGTVSGKPPGFLYYRTTDSLLYVWAGTRWIVAGSRGGSGSGVRDTVEVKDDLYVTINPLNGRQVIGRFQDDGIVSGGIVTSAGCLMLHVSPTSFYKNHNGTNYVTAGIDLTVPTPDGSNPRTDRIVADTAGNVFIITGTPSVTPQAPSYNLGSQISIATYPVAAGASCLAINSIIIYDETGGTEYDPTDANTVTDDPSNTSNPEHLTIADYVSEYDDSALLIFTKPSGKDTVFNNSIFRWGLYLLHPLTQQIQMQLFDGSTPVSNNISVNPYIAVNDTAEYQTVGLPWSAFGASGNIIFTKIVYTLRGSDLGGAGGFYLDYLQLQTGLNNFSNGHGVFFYGTNLAGDSTILIRDDGTIFKAPNGSGFRNLQQTLDVESARAKLNKNDTIDIQANALFILGNTATYNALITNGPLASGFSVGGNSTTINTQDNTGASIIGLLGTGSNYAKIRAQQGSTLIDLSVHKDSLEVRNNTLSLFKIYEANGMAQFGQYGQGNLITGTPAYLAAWDADGNLNEYPLQFQVNGTPNTLQYLINLVAGTGMTITDDGSGNVTFDASGGASINFIYNEEFTGSTSTTLTLSHNYTTGTIRLFKNGARLRASDFTEATANTITLNVARISGDVFITDFNY